MTMDAGKIQGKENYHHPHTSPKKAHASEELGSHALASHFKFGTSTGFRDILASLPDATAETFGRYLKLVSSNMAEGTKWLD